MRKALPNFAGFEDGERDRDPQIVEASRSWKGNTELDCFLELPQGIPPFNSLILTQ